jgi:hypothetical protein
MILKADLLHKSRGGWLLLFLHNNCRCTVFISRSSRDRDFAERLAANLPEEEDSSER